MYRNIILLLLNENEIIKKSEKFIGCSETKRRGISRALFSGDDIITATLR